MRTLPKGRICFAQALGGRIGLATQLGLVDAGHASAIHDKQAIDHHAVDRCAVFSEHDLVREVAEWGVVDVPEVQEDKIGL